MQLSKKAVGHQLNFHEKVMWFSGKILFLCCGTGNGKKAKLEKAGLHEIATLKSRVTL